MAELRVASKTKSAILEWKNLGTRTDTISSCPSTKSKNRSVFTPSRDKEISWHFGSFSFVVKSKVNLYSLGGNSIHIARMCWLRNMSPLATVALQEDK